MDIERTYHYNGFEYDHSDRLQALEARCDLLTNLLATLLMDNGYHYDGHKLMDEPSLSPQPLAVTATA